MENHLNEEYGRESTTQKILTACKRRHQRGYVPVRRVCVSWRAWPNMTNTTLVLLCRCDLGRPLRGKTRQQQLQTQRRKWHARNRIFVFIREKLCSGGTTWNTAWLLRDEEANTT